MTNIDLSEIGGTQTWTEAMAKELLRQGHEVTLWSPRVGEFAEERLSDFVVTDALPIQSFDVCLVNHNMCLNAIRPISGHKILTCHGPSHVLERPIPGADGYVAVSEEIAQAYPSFDFTVIRNGIDLERFKPPQDDPDKVLIATKNAEIQRMCEEACGLAGYSYIQANYQSHPTYEIEKLMAESSIVITSGRGAYEALACNRSVIVLTNRPTPTGEWIVRADGWATPHNIHDLHQRNCSGRTNNMQWGSMELADSLNDWEGPETWGRDFVTEHHDIRQQARQYLSLVEEEVVA